MADFGADQAKVDAHHHEPGNGGGRVDLHPLHCVVAKNGHAVALL
jgi:hypothetical protein